MGWNRARGERLWSSTAACLDPSPKGVGPWETACEVNLDEEEEDLDEPNRDQTKADLMPANEAKAGLVGMTLPANSLTA